MSHGQDSLLGDYILTVQDLSKGLLGFTSGVLTMAPMGMR